MERKNMQNMSHPIIMNKKRIYQVDKDIDDVA